MTITHERGPMADKSKKKINIRMELPPPTVEVLEKHGIKIEIKGTDRKILMDQGSGMAEGDGCISNPGGPSC
jgi:hypothetical protein